MLKRRPSTLSTAGLAVIATLGALLPRPAVATPTFIQGLAFSTPRIPSTTVTLTYPVAQGDLLVGWFSQYNAPGEIQVSDNVNEAMPPTSRTSCPAPPARSRGA